MARFSGLIGFAHTKRTAPGVSSEVITEKGPYFGDVKRKSRTMRGDDSVNAELSLSNVVEILADDYASENIFAIRFVEWAGACWTVVEATVVRPRLLLRLGGVYDGARAKRETPPAEVPDTP
jgi:hypothetical protein